MSQQLAIWDSGNSSKAVASWEEADTLGFRAERKHGRALGALFKSSAGRWLPRAEAHYYEAIAHGR
jgi:hypothetical protein